MEPCGAVVSKPDAAGLCEDAPLVGTELLGPVRGAEHRAVHAAVGDEVQGRERRLQPLQRGDEVGLGLDGLAADRSSRLRCHGLRDASHLVAAVAVAGGVADPDHPWFVTTAIPLFCRSPALFSARRASSRVRATAPMEFTVPVQDALRDDNLPSRKTTGGMGRVEVDQRHMVPIS